MKNFNSFMEINNLKKQEYYHILTPYLLDNNFFTQRNEFAQKGTFGHGLLIAGSLGKGGASILAGRASLRLGLGLLTIHIPTSLNSILQISVPEAMLSLDDDNEVFSSDIDTHKFSAIAIGCGLDTKQKSKEAVIRLLSNNTLPLIIDADGLNIIAKIKNFQSLLHRNTILTPHEKEFERLFGTFSSYEKKLEFMRHFSIQTGITIILKGGITAISVNTGDIFFNTIGNAGMATAGSGDVLTGILLGILTQGYPTAQTAKIGVFLHALAGDIAKEKIGETSLIASDIIENISLAIERYKSK